jgi:hypothetical protein
MNRCFTASWYAALSYQALASARVGKFDDNDAFDLGAFKDFVRAVVGEDLDIVPRQGSTHLLPVGVELCSVASTQSRKNNVGGHVFS